ncbi:hypothetical protein HYPGJ_31622 [Hyphomicrobium sp. GJ21]|nr:hypothetical protein HYPGJ_31622 [Hyphomicrobium sp. GJ21]
MDVHAMSTETFITTVEETYGQLRLKAAAMSAAVKGMEGAEADVAVMILSDVERSIAFLEDVLACFATPATAVPSKPNLLN